MATTRYLNRTINIDGALKEGDEYWTDWGVRFLLDIHFLFNFADAKNGGQLLDSYPFKIELKWAQKKAKNLNDGG